MAGGEDERDDDDDDGESKAKCNGRRVVCKHNCVAALNDGKTGMLPVLFRVLSFVER